MRRGETGAMNSTKLSVVLVLNNFVAAWLLHALIKAGQEIWSK